MDSTQAQTKLEKAYKKAGGKTALPWADIIAIIMKVLQGCTTPNAKAFVKKHPLAAQFLIERSLADDDIGSPKDRKILSAAGVTAFNSTNEKDLDDLRFELELD